MTATENTIRFSVHTLDKATKAKVTLENYYSNLVAQHVERKQRLVTTILIIILFGSAKKPSDLNNLDLCLCFRLAKLEESLKDESLSEEQKHEKRLQHAQKETEFLRLKRSR